MYRVLLGKDDASEEESYRAEEPADRVPWMSPGDERAHGREGERRQDEDRVERDRVGAQGCPVQDREDDPGSDEGEREQP
jgi:hypothetical protein